MAFDEFLLDRLRESLNRKNIRFEEKKMMGAIVIMKDEKMLIGLGKNPDTKEDRMMVRIGEFAQELCTKRTGCRTMEFTGRLMKGFVYVDPEGFDMDEDWEFWVEKALEYNPFAKKSKK